MIELAHAPETVERGGGGWRQKTSNSEARTRGSCCGVWESLERIAPGEVEDIKRREIKCCFTHLMELHLSPAVFNFVTVTHTKSHLNTSQASFFCYFSGQM